MAKKNTPIDFEKSLTELEQLVSDMEHGDLPLEKALAEFERGVTLTKHCQEALHKAEQKVQILMQDQTLIAFETPHE
ncbi:MAG: exodeoxyribonuclease VII small subunit [Methylococcales bacterium]|jgi:exodeoxyribonuclease VII small subunit|nr:exodeoxyribonuclease VII small subunit [Methylococcales bacterium]MBT7445941.1 exodeoxyribonuclease VII small subunit [Methylococcales bacterium]